MGKNLRLRLLSFFVVCIYMAAFTVPAGLRAQGTDSLLFRDDFNRTALGSRWESPTSWTIQDQKAYLFAGPNRWLRTSTAFDLPSYIIETAAIGFTPGYRREFRATFGQENIAVPKMYVLQYQPYFGGIVTLGRATDNLFYPQILDEAVAYPALEKDKLYKFKIARYKSGLIQVYIDRGAGYGATPILEAIDDTYKTMGKIGLRVDTETADEAFYVDWAAAYKPATEKPAIKEKPAEDNLVTQVSAESGRAYAVTKIATGIKAYTDRSYTITSFPDYMKGASFVQTAMDDKKNSSATFLTSFIKKSAIVYIGYDPRAKAIPAWLSSWTKTGDRIGINDPGSAYLDVYSKLVESWEVYPYPFLLGGNMASPAAGAQMNYVVAAIERPGSYVLEAENAVYKGAVAASNHPGYSGSGFIDYVNKSNDFIEWNVKIDVPGSYNLGFAFANGGTANRPLQIAHNGTALGQLPFSQTFSWSSWAFTSGPSVYLKQGIHTIRATATGASGPNIDYLSLSYLEAGPAGAAPLLVAAAKTSSDFLLREQGSFAESAMAYPNPFQGSTHIVYEVSKAGRVQLALFNIHGQIEKLLVNEIQQPGKYRIAVNGSSMPAGTYFYRLQSGAEVRVGKLVRQ
jgi:hypothetical protein